MNEPDWEGEAPSPRHATTKEDVIDLLREYREIERLAALREWTALMVARTPDAWFQLLAGKPVPEDQLDRDYLRRAQARLGT